MLAQIAAIVLAAGTPEANEYVTAEFIVELAPRVGQHRAEVLANAINEQATFQGIDPTILAAIIRQESTFRSGLKVCYPVTRKGVTSTTCDYGLAQVNEVWIGKWKLDPDRLQNDDTYNIRVAARVLGWYRHYFGEEANWYSRYNTGIPSKRAKYEENLSLYMASR